MVHERLFVHGAGRRGADAWPAMDPENDELLSFAPGSTIAEQVDRLARDYAGRRLLVFAHSIGAVPVLLAAKHLDLAGIVLIEPALYDIARGHAAIERHIAVVSEARGQATAGDLRAFWAILRPLMFGGPFDADRWTEERPLAQHWATTNLPWGHGVRERMLGGIQTLVVTGGWNEEYETIARLLVDEGAQHRVLAGTGHRSQDADDFPAIVRAFAASLAP